MWARDGGYLECRTRVLLTKGEILTSSVGSQCTRWSHVKGAFVSNAEALVGLLKLEFILQGHYQFGC